MNLTFVTFGQHRTETVLCAGVKLQLGFSGRTMYFDGHGRVQPVSNKPVVPEGVNVATTVFVAGSMIFTTVPATHCGEIPTIILPPGSLGGVCALLLSGASRVISASSRAIKLFMMFLQS